MLRKNSTKIGKITIVICAVSLLVLSVTFLGCNYTGTAGSEVEKSSSLNEDKGKEAISADKSSEVENAAGEESDETSEEDSQISFEITDSEGTVLQFEKPAKNIIVLAPNALEIIDGLGEMEVVSEIDSFTVSSKEPLAEGFEGVGDNQSLNVEKIAEINPDVIITLTGGPDEDYQKIKDLGIKIYRVIDIKGFDGVYEEIANISKIIGLEEEGSIMIDELEGMVEEIQNKTKNLTDDKRPATFYEVWNDPLMSAGIDTFINDLIKIAGGINILAEDELTGWPEYSVETLVEKNPQIIIAPVSLAADASVIKSDQRFSSIDAVLNDRIYIVPDNPVSRPSQNIIKGLQMFAKAIHPEIFGDFEVIE